MTATGLLLVALVLSAFAAPVSAQENTASVESAVQWLLTQQANDGGFIGFSGESDAGATVDAVLALDTQWRAQLAEVEVLRAKQKAANNEMAALKKGSPEFIAKVQEMKAGAAQVKEKEVQLTDTESKWRMAMLKVPNIPHASVPEGATPEQNVVFATHGSIEQD